MTSGIKIIVVKRKTLVEIYINLPVYDFKQKQVNFYYLLE